MSSAYVSSLAIYHLKSSAAIASDSVEVLPAGLLGDRRFMLSKMDGTFITGRTHPKITSIVSEYVGDVLVLKHASCDDLKLDPANFSTAYHATVVWGTNFLGQGCGYEADQWVSSLFDEPLRILYFGDKSNRQVVKHPEHEVGFADGFPLLIANTESLEHLNQRLLAPISMANFRPNIVISGVPAWAEDEWAQIRIAEVVFDLPKPCGRCIFTTVDPVAAIFDPKLEPLKTLGSYRKQPTGSDVIFGENMLALNSGTIKVGDKVEILKSKIKPAYLDNWQPQTARMAQHLAISSQPNSANSTQLLLRCVQIITETADVKTFKFTADPISRFSYLPGQFITIHPEIDNKTYNRCYTLSSSPSQPDLISITVKQVADGVVSNWLHDSFSVGSTLAATNAAGVFHLKANSRRKLLLLSAGSGVTPMLSMLRYITDLALNVDVHFHHSAKTESDLICFAELQLLAKRFANIHLSYNFSRQSEVPKAAINKSCGRLTKAALQAHCADLLERDVLVCGPDDFMSSAHAMLLELGLPESQYDQESFVISTTEIVADQASEMYQVKFLQAGIEVKVAGDQTILQAAEEAGIYLDYSCLAGVCGSCNTTLISGSLHAPDAMAIDMDDEDSNEFLPCCSYARSDLEVDL